jgi:hypothetical protein
MVDGAHVSRIEGAAGLGQHQVTQKTDRAERSMAVPIMADLFLLKLRA